MFPTRHLSLLLSLLLVPLLMLVIAEGSQATTLSPLLTSTSTTAILGPSVTPTGVTLNAKTVGWGWQNPLSQVNSLYGVWGSSASDVFAVGAAGTILHYDGSSWSPMDSGITNDIFGIWGSSASDVFAVSAGYNILHYDGSSWSPMTMSSDTVNYLVGVWGSSASDVFAVGWSGTILHYDGSSWSPMDSGTESYLHAVWGSSASDVFAVSAGGNILHYDGHSWSSMNSGTGFDLNAVWGSSHSDVFAVAGTILHYNGSSWSTMDSGTGPYLNAVWGSSASDVFAVGGSGTILHYDGSSWSTVASDNKYNLNAVWGSSASDVFGVGDGGRILHYSISSTPISGLTLTPTPAPKAAGGIKLSIVVIVAAVVGLLIVAQVAYWLWTRKRKPKAGPEEVSKSEGIGMSLSDISFKIGNKTILENITMDIPAGRTTGILGPNGAGKTTLLNLLTGLRNPNSGTIQLSDKSLTVGSVEYRNQIGVVMQETALYDELTTYENLAFSASLYGIENPRERIFEILELLSLADRAEDKVMTLSGGLQRRVTIARALLHNSRMLIIDEPTLGVDADARHMIWSHLRYLKSRGTTIIVSTNYLDEALALCDTVSVLSKGRLLYTKEEPDKLLAKVGICVDIVCEDISTDHCLGKVKALAGIIKVDKTSEGMSVFFKGDIPQDEMVREIMNVVPIKGFKLRSPDLSEVFLLLENENP